MAPICSIKKPTKGPILYDFHLNEVPRPVQSIETESRMQVARSQRGGVSVSWGQCQFGRTEKVLEMAGGDGGTAMNVPNATELDA